jgi:hypothetical protein
MAFVPTSRPSGAERYCKATDAELASAARSRPPVIHELCARHNRRPAAGDRQIARSRFPSGRFPQVNPEHWTVVPLCMCERQPRPISAGLNETVGWPAKQAPGMT